ncbi:MAG: hypothetical protein OXB98_01720 [Bryobacterales bacterium]|nr:hypothetical protein [Bryobacterales bacterium]
MTHPQAAAQLHTINETLDRLDGEKCLRSTHCITKMMLIDEKLSRLLHNAVNTAIDERDTLSIEF